MNILRTLIQTDVGNDFLADAVHETGKISKLTVSPIIDGVVGSPMPYKLEELPDLTKRLEELLTDIC